MEAPSTSLLGLVDALPALLPVLAALAEAEPDREVCGFVLAARDGELTVHPARNAAPDPARRFEVDPRDLFAVHRRAREGGPAVAAIYHSHPRGGAALSAVDRAALLLEDGAPLLPGVALVVVGMGGGKAEEVRIHRWAAPGAFDEVARAERIHTSGEGRDWVISANVP